MILIYLPQLKCLIHSKILCSMKLPNHGQLIHPLHACMWDVKCTKNYLLSSVQENKTGEDGYPLYRRRKPRHSRFTSKIKMRNGQEFTIDSQQNVPYYPFLTKNFKAYINVEFCNSFKFIKYVWKYVNKGSNAAIYTLMQNGSQHINKNEEVTQYERERCISSNLAFWHIFKIYQEDKNTRKLLSPEFLKY